MSCIKLGKEAVLINVRRNQSYLSLFQIVFTIPTSTKTTVDISLSTTNPCVDRQLQQNSDRHYIDCHTMFDCFVILYMWKSFKATTYYIHIFRCAPPTKLSTYFYVHIVCDILGLPNVRVLFVNCCWCTPTPYNVCFCIITYNIYTPHASR